MQTHKNVQRILTGTHKKKEVRFNPSGQVFMRQQRSASVLAPRSNVHIHTVTLGESLELIKKINYTKGPQGLLLLTHKIGLI